MEYIINLNSINNNNNENSTLYILKNKKLACTFYFKINNKNENNKDNNGNFKKEYIVAGEKGLYHFKDSPFKLDSLDEYSKSKMPYKGSIKINDNFIVLTSNRIYSKGKDKLVIYDTKKEEIMSEILEKKEQKEINGSFVGGVNGLMLIDIEENRKVIVCACKQYISGQSNGILTINLELKEANIEIKSQKFYDTENFEVNCFCQINKEDKNNKNIYFLVGGFENVIREGIIQLYRLVKDEDIYNLEYLQMIDIDKNNFDKFKGTINCIIQYKNNGKILVNCIDGIIYCFSKPNIDYYLEEEEEDIAGILKNF